MLLNVQRYRYGSKKKKKKGWLLLLGALLILLLLAAVWWLRSSDRLKLRKQVQAKTLNDLWNDRLYDELIARCEQRLAANPLDYTALVYHGFSSFYTAVSEASLEDRIPYLERSIISLRRAKLLEMKRWTPELLYILGKAYYHRGKYYYDLAIEYLNQALVLNLQARDIYDYLGLSYTQLGMVEEGLEQFLKALEFNPTDLLLLTVGQSYLELNRSEQAREYLIRAVNKSEDPAIIKKSRFFLGQLYFEKSDYFKAEHEYRQILVLDPQAADAHFYLGEIYLKLNDPVKARAEWRKALSIDPSHYGAKLRYYR